MPSFQLPPYQLPRFYEQLETQGVNQEPPRSDFEIFRGSLPLGSWIIITIDGTISHSNDQPMQDQIDLALEELQQLSPSQQPDQQQRYVILAKHSPPDWQSLPVNHLNIWLNHDQFDYAVTLLQNHDEIIEQSTSFEFETHRFEFNGRNISFHDNGKIIAEDGYASYAPLLSQAIEQYLPYSEFDLIIGQDEVGTGERIGPLVIGSVATTPTELVDLQLAGIKDSKMVPKGLTTTMTGWIRDIATLTSTYQLEPVPFNQLVLGERRNIAEILTDSHNQAVVLMKKRLRQYGALHEKMIYLVDQYHRYEKLASLEEDPEFDCEVVYLPGAERQSVAVAAASIMAKAERYRWIRAHEKVYNIKLKRKRIKQISRHEKAHELLKII